MTTPHLIYRAVSLSGRCYIGMTSQTVNERWKTHRQTAMHGSGFRHPLYAAIRKYGAETFCLEVIEHCASMEEAQAAEVHHIAAYRGRGERLYNVSPGGEDHRIGTQRLRELLTTDPEWAAAYRKALSEGCKASPRHRERVWKITERAATWRAANPEAVKAQALRASLAAAETNKGKKQGPRKWKPPLGWGAAGGAAARQKWLTMSPEERGHHRARRQQYVAKVWAVRTDTERKAVAAKIAVTLRVRNAGRTPEQCAVAQAQLAGARKNIDHDLRKRRQKEALLAYWTPERRAQFGAERRARAAAKRALSEPTTS